MKQIPGETLGVKKSGSTSEPLRSGCLVYRNRDPEYADSPEFQYLEAYQHRQMQSAFGGFSNTSTPSAIADDDRFKYVLWLGDDRTLITSASLKRMIDRVEDGAEFVAPVRLDSIMQAIQTPVPTTLRLFEEIELELFDARERWKQPSSGMVLLGTRESFQALVSGRRAQTESDSPFNPFALIGEKGLVQQGICFQFVDYYGQERADILPFIPADTNEVLEIGCAKGLTGKLLRERLGCNVTGVEQNPAIAEHARQYLSKVIVGNIETLQIDEKFDVVLATELFEHLQSPIEFLQSMKAVLRPGGRIVLTVPNVGHWSIVEDLIQGRWDYVPMGILCYTHFRFFTYKTIEDWILLAGFSTYEIVRQITELPERFLSLPNIAVDCQSLSTSGFYVVIHAQP
jgi:SAM-dependent methyltransferase